ncbi:threonine/homoserine/homoserine lactone efflux protein [Mycoplana sp. BE70]|uniref:LysE family translocator n=1 Tax=Mycoplana sp. BE70 TaxID=2817775 RepID=UPI0028567179|nr:LysE family translocator [Mycoplana sp. BE70]MDR6756018.1 threonine/homoserine/homoserine lactone efflux protein [Mycoplana sp. BE70]
MTYAENLWLFFLLLAGIIVVPGMDMIYVLASSLSGGRRAGLSATFGIMAGGLVHTLYAALGVGVLLHYVPALFNALLVAGAAYIAWIGWTLARSSISIDGIGAVAKRGLWTRFRQGALTSLMNPKAYLFMLAVFPQFLRPEFGPIWRQASVMVLMIWMTQLAVYGSLAVAAGRGRDMLVGSPQATRFVGRASGLLLIAIAVVTLWRGWGGA